MRTGMRILFVSRKATQCGVADYGKRLFSILKDHFDIINAEITTSEDFNKAYSDTKPDVVLYNYYCTTLPFITDALLSDKRDSKHVVIYHESGVNFTPDKKIDTLPRPIYNVQLPPFWVNEVPVIGSFGFGFANKNFVGIAEAVKKEYDEAIIRLNIPFAEFGDSNGDQAKSEAAKIRDAVKGTKIKVEINHEFLSPEALIYSLSRNDINLFLYTQMHGRGYSSSIDYALAAGRPIGISNSYMFRHLPSYLHLENSSIKELISKGFPQEVMDANSHEKLIETYKQLLNDL